jgi:cell division protein FtsL
LPKNCKAELIPPYATNRPKKKVVMQATQIIHAYKQAPWRVQRQYVGAFLLLVISASMIAALYLSVTARAAVAGRGIQELRIEITTIQRANADLETQLADLTSTVVMQQRALQLGYRPVKPGELDYIAVPGYVAPEPAILLAAEDVISNQQIIPAEYTQSLIEWFDERIKFGGTQQ